MSLAEIEILDEDLLLFLGAIKKKSDYDFTNYSMKSLKRRVLKIMSDNKLSISELTHSIRTNPVFLEKIVKNITVNTTELFRDPKIWLSIKNEILPPILHNNIIRIWHPGCSTGQEVYSMMIILNELGVLAKSEIYASDINADVLDIAKTGIFKYRYNQHYIENFDAVVDRNIDNSTSHDKYFTLDKENNTLKMCPFLIQKPIFKKIDLVKDGNLFKVKFDLIVCRNVIIYFNYELQNKIFDMFYQNLDNKGCMILGLHESVIGPYATFFEKKNHVYYKRIV